VNEDSDEGVEDGDDPPELLAVESDDDGDD